MSETLSATRFCELVYSLMLTLLFGLMKGSR